ncbi:uncharacterized protein P884DRAFT_111042 [Thermothelomyces heterothallicus CBS 202.75]|uniref:uncharacterized protein n=1 Tax=Thermothelomyces heterothallicus CBS 202.75 TaxID=1149848 RepID=UPI0037429734
MAQPFLALCPFSFFLFPSECRGFTCISEDSSEITFLLVENYNLTAPSWLRPAGEFLEHHSRQEKMLCCLSLPTLAGLSGRAWRGRARAKIGIGWEREVRFRLMVKGFRERLVVLALVEGGRRASTPIGTAQKGCPMTQAAMVIRPAQTCHTCLKLTFQEYSYTRQKSLGGKSPVISSRSIRRLFYCASSPWQAPLDGVERAGLKEARNR